MQLRVHSLPAERLAAGKARSTRGLAVCRPVSVPRPGHSCCPAGRPQFESLRVAAAAAEAAPGAKAAPHWQQALDAIAAKKDGQVVIAQIAPAVRVAIAETMGLAPGEVTIGQLVTGLRQIGFDYVFDTLFGADLTIMEEGTELLHRLKAHLQNDPNKEEPLPMFTSCCPGWVAMVEKSNPELIPYLSTCKSPQMMLGAVIKNYFAQETGKAAADITNVSVMPCVRKQGEADREWFNSSGQGRDVDHAMTTAELGKIFVERGIKLNELPESEFDCLCGEGTGGAVLFGTTGGVMEAALRTVYEAVTCEPMGRIVFEEARGLDGLKEAKLTIKPGEKSPFKMFEGPNGDGITLSIAVANGLGSAKKLVKSLQDGSAKYDFIEVMACPGGCIGGGGQPRSADKQILAKRQAAMYALDERSTIRRSHENPLIQQLYKTFLGEANGHKAHELLHTHYVPGGVPDDK
uniref:Iron hydrogenase n=1 Tax=Scenedesmus sp. SE-MC3 TaxID=2315450 RepID=A0A346THI9_9CHLO|nr:iron hydrogenase [Scenedesmus sp. SE-MC3]